MKIIKNVLLMLLFCFFYTSINAQWIDISMDDDSDLNTIEYIPETGDFYVGGTDGLYKWDQNEWNNMYVAYPFYTSVYNDGLLAFNRTVCIAFSTLGGDFEDWDFYYTDFPIEDIFSYQDKAVLLSEKTYYSGEYTYGLIMDNVGEIVDTLYYPHEISDSTYYASHYFLKAGFSIDNEIFIFSYYNDQMKNDPENDVTTLYKTSDLGVNWEEVAVLDGRPLDAKAEGNVVAVSMDVPDFIMRLIKSYDGFQTWEIEDLYSSSYIDEVDIYNNIYCAGSCAPDGSDGFLYSDDYETFDNFIFSLEVVDIATMVTGMDGYAKIKYNDTYIETLSKNNNLKVYPNPFIDIINVSMEENTPLRLYDSKGCLVDELNGKQFNLSYLPKGMYVLKSYDQFVRIVKR